MMYRIFWVWAVLYCSQSYAVLGQQPKLDYEQLIKAVVSEVQKQRLRQPKIDESICLRWIDSDFRPDV